MNTKPKTKTPRKTKAVRESNFKRWRKERGLKMVMSIMPMRGGQKRATCLFEGNTYIGVGTNNIVALENCIALVIKKGNLND